MLLPGHRLGAYHVVSLLGEGGMGAVYRARDMKLDRDVAIKVLPDSFAKDPDRLMRFEREAKTLASLNHPNIAAIYGIEEHALVMELVEGEDLSARIARGAIPLDEALPIAKQIAEALEAAHEQGIIHRDLKPANIKVRADGTVKVLDFGLSKAIDQGSGIGDQGSGRVANSPTITSPAMTQAGMILGTAAYMSPEQARGVAVDKRSDIWAFGVIVQEMLTAVRPFDGTTVSDTIAAVLKTDPDWNTLPADTPAAIRRLLRRCLEKDRRRRLADAADARFEIEDALTEPTSGDTHALRTSAPRSARVLPWLVAGALGVALTMVVALGGLVRGNDAGASRPLVHFDVELGADVSLPAVDSSGSIAISPDGSRLVYVSGTPSKLFTRRLDQSKASELPGTDGARAPFFSPDGKWIGFAVGPNVQKVSLDGGAVVALAEVPGFTAASWAQDDTIFVAAGPRPLRRIPAGGGAAAPVTEFAEGELGHGEPSMLPGGGAILLTTDRPGPPEKSSVDVVTLADGHRKTVLRGAASARYIAGANGTGQLVYATGSTLFAVPFDLQLLEPQGTAVPLFGDVAHEAVTGAAEFTISGDGTLVYRRALGDARALATVQWVDAGGKSTPLRTIAGDYTSPHLSPDGTRLAMAVTQGGNIDIWILDIKRDAMIRLTSGGINNRVAWTPDSQHVAFSRAGEGIWITRADGSSQPQALTARLLQYPHSFTPDGKRLAYVQASQVWSVAIEQQGGTWKVGTAERFFESAFADTQPAFSPDGRWLAYQSDESGRLEIYVRPFPAPSGRQAGKWQISVEGGSTPLWSRKGQVVFRAGDRIMAAGYTVNGDTFVAEKPRVWIEGLDIRRGRSQEWDLAPDGSRIIVLTPVGASTESAREHQIVVVQNFAEEVRRRVSQK